MTTPYDLGYEDGASGLDSNNVTGDPSYDDGYIAGHADYIKVFTDMGKGEAE